MSDNVCENEHNECFIFRQSVSDNVCENKHDESFIFCQSKYVPNTPHHQALRVHQTLRVHQALRVHFATFSVKLQPFRQRQRESLLTCVDVKFRVIGQHVVSDLVEVILAQSLEAYRPATVQNGHVVTQQVLQPHATQ